MDMASPTQERCKVQAVQNNEEGQDDDTENGESDQENLTDETLLEYDGNISEDEQDDKEADDNDAEDTDNVSTISTTVNLNSDSANSGSEEGAEQIGVETRRQLSNHRLDPFLCNVCKKYVRGGVITICGHLFCWTCLWPLLDNRVHPNCPHCLRRLILHEDIMPFHGEGPYADAADANEVAQPGNVERPSGLYLNEDHPDWFSVNEYERLVMNTLTESETERNLFSVVRKVPVYHPYIGTCLTLLNWTQYSIALLMFILWIFFSLN